MIFLAKLKELNGEAKHLSIYDHTIEVNGFRFNEDDLIFQSDVKVLTFCSYIEGEPWNEQMEEGIRFALQGDDDFSVGLQEDHLPIRLVSLDNDSNIQSTIPDEYDRFEAFVFLPSKKSIVYMQEGCGDQLMQEDLDAGYNDYVDYKICSYNESLSKFEEGDGGIFLYNNKECSGSWHTKIGDTIKFAFDEAHDIPMIFLGS